MLLNIKECYFIAILNYFTNGIPITKGMNFIFQSVFFKIKYIRNKEWIIPQQSLDHYA